jgi:hypothetical protein
MKMTQAEYNAKVQELQEMWGDASRVAPHISKDLQRVTHARFQVYWDGRWQTLGTQHNPFTPEATYEWDEELELRLRGSFADALAHS